MPSARTTSLGSALNSRFGVDGIQYSSSEIGFACERPESVNSAWPMEVSRTCEGAPSHGCECAMICLCAHVRRSPLSAFPEDDHVASNLARFCVQPDPAYRAAPHDEATWSS